MANEHEATTPEELGRMYAAAVGAGPDAAMAEERGDTPPPALRIIEALLFVGGAPLTAKRAREILRGLAQEQFDAAVAELNADYRRQNRPYAILPQATGWVLTLKPRFRQVIDKLYGGVREARLSTPAIDVLALVAYRQPVTKADVDTLRGADSAALLRQLLRRGLVQIAPLPGGKAREVVYSTTAKFLDMFGLQTLDDLPKTHDLQTL